MATTENVTETAAGNPMKMTVSKYKIGLLTRVVNQRDFTRAWSSRATQSAIAEQFGINTNDIQALCAYWEMPPRAKAFSTRTAKSADRLWAEFEPRIRALITEMTPA